MLVCVQISTSVCHCLWERCEDEFFLFFFFLSLSCRATKILNGHQPNIDAAGTLIQCSMFAVGHAQGAKGRRKESRHLQLGGAPAQARHGRRIFVETLKIYIEAPEPRAQYCLVEASQKMDGGLTQTESLVQTCEALLGGQAQVTRSGWGSPNRAADHAVSRADKQLPRSRPSLVPQHELKAERRRVFALLGRAVVLLKMLAQHAQSGPLGSDMNLREHEASGTH